MIRRRWLQMLPAALLAHAVVTLCAASAALALASDVAPPPLAADGARVAALVTLLRLCSRASQPWRYAVLPVLCTLSSAPLLASIWLRSSEIDAPLAAHARAVRSIYLRALTVWASCAAYALALCAIAVASSFATARVWSDPRAQAIAAGLVALPFLLALIHPLTLLDSANLALVRGAPSALSALREGLAAIDRCLLCLRAAFLLASGAIVLLGVLARACLGWSAAATVATFGLGQLGALATLALRSLWLALLSDRFRRPESGSRALPASGSTARIR